MKNNFQLTTTIVKTLPLEESIPKHHRCKNCEKLLGIDNLVVPTFDVKCNRCGTINPIFNGLERQVIITDTKGTIIYVNHRIEEVTGYSAKEILGNKPASLWGGQMKPEFYKTLWHQIAVEKKAVAVELVNRTKAGELYSVALRISPLLDEHGEVEFFMGIETIIQGGEKQMPMIKSELR